MGQSNDGESVRESERQKERKKGEKRGRKKERDVKAKKIKLNCGP